MSISRELADKSVQAVIAAIEVYNKPYFLYREEAFSLLMANAWELLLKAKWLLKHNDELESLYEYEMGSHGEKIPKKNRTGNPLTFGAPYLIAKLLEDKHSGLEKNCCLNITALLEIRDNAAHLINKDLYLGKRILEIGTASLQNYLHLTTDWFQLDLSRYNFFLMPISFYHGFEVAQPTSLNNYPEQVKKLLDYLSSLESETEDQESRHHFSLRIETKLVRGNDDSALGFRWTDDPSAPTLTIRDEDILKRYPLTFKELTAMLRKRYNNFLQNNKFNKILKALRQEKRFTNIRHLNPSNPKSATQYFYSTNILQEFDKHYRHRRK